MEPKIRHLEMIQSTMSRASDNSLRIKGFAMLLLAGTLALALRDGISASVIPLPIALILWVFVAILFSIDVYFIKQSNALRILYNQVQRRSADSIDFSMELTRYQHPHDLQDRGSRDMSLYIIATSAFYLSILMVLMIGALAPALR